MCINRKSGRNEREHRKTQESQDLKSTVWNNREIEKVRSLLRPVR